MYRLLPRAAVWVHTKPPIMLILILDTILVTGESIQQFIMGLGQLCDIINYLHIIQLNPDKYKHI